MAENKIDELDILNFALPKAAPMDQIRRPAALQSAARRSTFPRTKPRFTILRRRSVLMNAPT